VFEPVDRKMQGPVIDVDCAGHVRVRDAHAREQEEAMSNVGHICDTSGVYAFVGYTDAAASLLPIQEGRVITLRSGQPFPPIRSTDRGAHWKVLRTL
jgi:hypothetical protein